MQTRDLLGESMINNLVPMIFIFLVFLKHQLKSSNFVYELYYSYFKSGVPAEVLKKAFDNCFGPDLNYFMLTNRS